LVCVVACAFGYLENNGALGLSRSLDDSLELLHVVEIEGRNSISALDGLGEHITSVHQTQFFVTYHNC